MLPMESYKSLILVAIFITTISLALQISYGCFDLVMFLNHFLGMMFIFFALFKFVDLTSFIESFRKYDLIGQKSRIYCTLHPFIEFILGLLFLSQLSLLPTYIFSAIFAIISILGVIYGIKHPEKHKCACLGSALDVPLTNISLIEDSIILIISIFLISIYV